MENKSYQELFIDLFATCLNIYSESSELELVKKHVSLLRMTSDVCADIGEELTSVLSMMILSLEERPDLSLKDRKSFVYGMSAANRDMGYFDLSQEEEYRRSLLEFRCTDSHFNVYDIDNATLGYQMHVFHELQPKFLQKK